MRSWGHEIMTLYPELEKEFDMYMVTSKIHFVVVIVQYFFTMSWLVKLYGPQTKHKITELNLVNVV